MRLSDQVNKLKLIIKFAYDICTNFITSKKVILITESVNWSINEDSKNIQKYLKDKISFKISITHIGARNKILHFMSANTFINNKGIAKISKSNKIILTWFHIVDTDKDRITKIPKLNNIVNYVHTASEITKKKLIAHGLDKNKIILIPLGVNLNEFYPITAQKKKILRKKLNLPLNKKIIGSFQKDGDGWGMGTSPKLIKGPDVFCDAVEKIAKKIDIHIMLTGPARGYVINRLQKAGIPYTHVYLKRAGDVATYFKVIDLYIIASREEGGPKALLEAMATGIPLISTKVGMVPDLILSKKIGFLVNNEDFASISSAAINLFKNESKYKFLRQEMSKKIKAYEINKITQQYYHKIYKKLL